MPNDLKQRLEPLREAEPDEEADHRGEEPDDAALERSPSVGPARRVAPRVRSVPNSRARCAIVIESVFAITKTPTNSAIPPNASRNFCRMLVKSLVSCVCFAASCSPLRTCVVGGRIGADLGDHGCAARRPCFAATSISSSFADLAEELLRGRQIEDRHRRPAERRDVAELHDPGDPELLNRRRARPRRSSCRPCSASPTRCACRSRSRAVRAASGRR